MPIARRTSLPPAGWRCRSLLSGRVHSRSAAGLFPVRQLGCPPTPPALGLAHWRESRRSVLRILTKGCACSGDPRNMLGSTRLRPKEQSRIRAGRERLTSWRSPCSQRFVARRGVSSLWMTVLRLGAPNICSHHIKPCDNTGGRTYRGGRSDCRSPRNLRAMRSTPDYVVCPLHVPAFQPWGPVGTRR